MPHTHTNTHTHAPSTHTDTHTHTQVAALYHQSLRTPVLIASSFPETTAMTCSLSGTTQVYYTVKLQYELRDSAPRVTWLYMLRKFAGSPAHQCLAYSTAAAASTCVCLHTHTHTPTHTTHQQHNILRCSVIVALLQRYMYLPHLAELLSQLVAATRPAACSVHCTVAHAWLKAASAAKHWQ